LYAVCAFALRAKPTHCVQKDKVSLASDQLYSLGRLGGAFGPSKPPQWWDLGAAKPPPDPTPKCKVRKNLVKEEKYRIR